MVMEMLGVKGYGVVLYPSVIMWLLRAGRGEQRHAANLAAELLVDVPLNTRRNEE